LSEVRCDIEGILAKIEQIGDRAHRGVAAMMKEQGMVIRDKARSNAPVAPDDEDGGTLESAITCESQRTGINGRSEVFVYIDGSRAKPDGTPVGEYMLLMHEGLAPYGSGFAGDIYNPKYPYRYSRKKAASGHDVGGKFLERAVEEHRPQIYYRARQIIKDSIK